MAMTMEPASKTLTANGLDLHYLDWGRADAPPLVCVHGFTGSAQAFNALARHLQRRWRVIAPDVRGHGESGWALDGAYGYADQAGDLAAFADALGLDRFTLIGTSMGGIIAMAYATTQGARLRGLVINDIGPEAEPGSQRITQTVGARPEHFATLDAAMAYRREVSPITAARPLADQRELALGVLKEAADGSWVWRMDPAYITQRAARVAAGRPVLWPTLSALQCPTLVIWGADSDVLLEPQARRMAAMLPHGELVAVPGIGHAPTLVEPAVLAALDRFLLAL